MFWFLFALSVFACLALLMAWGAYRFAFYHKGSPADPKAIPAGSEYQAYAERMLDLIGQVESLPYEQVFITARDGVKLAARYYHFRDNAPVQVHLHGYKANAIREFCRSFQMAMEMGYNVIAPDMRANGLSGGHTISFGVKERYDCAAWVQYVADRFGKDTQVILTGSSMGGATVLMASDLRLAANVVAITSDCACADPGAIIRKVCRDKGFPLWLVYPFFVLGALVFGGFRIWESSALKSVRNTEIPILFVHGDADGLVPWEMSQQLYDVCASRCELYIFPGAGHGMCYLADTERYDAVFKAFLLSCGIGR